MNQRSSGANDRLRIAVIGTGYVGLVTGACLAHLGHQVTCVDTLVERVAAVNRGTSPFYEPSLPELLSSCVREGRLNAVTNPVAAVANSDIVFLAVGTPSNENGIDLSSLSAAATAIGKGLRGNSAYHVVVVKSTVVPGTTDTLVRGLIEGASGLTAGVFGLCMNPEFLREGSAVADFMDPDRIVIGQWDEKSGTRLGGVYGSFNCPKVFTTLRNAEMTKYASNALLATLISFSNEFSALCEATPGTDIEEVLSILHLDRRFAKSGADGPAILAYLRAGCGYGGSCLPKDVAAIRSYGTRQGICMELLDAVAEVNGKRPRQLLRLAAQVLGDLRGSAIAVLGLAFKPGTDDMRDSPGMALIKLLEQEGAVIRAYDPMISALPEGERVSICSSVQGALANADAAIIATACPEWRQYDWKELCSLMRNPVVLDGRNALSATRFPDTAMYIPIGKHFVPQGAAVGE